MTKPKPNKEAADPRIGEDVEPVSYVWPIGTSEYITTKAIAQAESDVKKILGQDRQGQPSDGQMRLVAVPLIPRLRVPITDSKSMKSEEVRTVTPLSAKIELSYHVASFSDALAVTHLQAQRVRTYMAFSTGEVFPLYVHAFGRALTILRAYPREDLQSSSMRLYDLWHDVERKMLDGQDLLDRVPFGSRLARAINRSGISIISENPEDSYLAAWTALELLAIEAYEGAGTTKRNVKRLRKSDLVHNLLRTRGRSPGRDTVKEYYAIRNDVAHGELALDRFRNLMAVLDDVRAVARESVVDALQAAGHLPKTKEPFTSRILIHSWDGSPLPRVERYIDRFPPTRVDQLPSRSQHPRGNAQGPHFR